MTTATNNTGYGYMINGVTAPQIYAINNGYATAVAFIQPSGQAGAFSDLDEWEWEEPIFPSVAIVEAEIANAL